MICHLFGSEPLSEAMVTYLLIELLETNFDEIWYTIQQFLERRWCEKSHAKRQNDNFRCDQRRKCHNDDISLYVCPSCFMVCLVSQLISLFFAATVAPTTSEYIITGFVQDCCNSSALAMELLQSCTKPALSISRACCLEAIVGATNHVLSSLCNSIGDRTPVDFTHRCPIFKWVIVTRLKDNTR